MALLPLVGTTDFSDWLGRSLELSEMPRAEAVLRRVSALVRSRAGGRTWADEDVPAEIVTVVLTVASRVWNNPNSARQQTAGPFSESYDVTGAYLTPEEASIVGRYSATSRGLWTLGTTRGDDLGDTVWVPVVGSDNVFPFLTTDDV